MKNLAQVKEVNDDFIQTTLEKKYLLPGESILEDIKVRFGKVIDSSVDKKSLMSMMFKGFIPAGSILYGLGNPKNVSLSNCYYIPVKEDSIEGISTALSENMKVFSWRGGVGNSFEVLRPKHSAVNNASNTSTGSVSFLPLFSTATQTIGQNGRRGASIFSHAIWHPDVIDFIQSKAHPEKVFEKDTLNNTLPNISGANISVKITDEFMKAVKSDKDWDLIFPKNDEEYKKYWNGDIERFKLLAKTPFEVYKTVKAKELMRLIAESAWNYAEPGVLFWDTIMKDTPMAVFDEFRPRGVNPCGEQILPDYGSCNLSSMILYHYVKHPFTKEATFDYEKFAKDVVTAVEFMDFIVSVNKHPLKQQQDLDQLGRKIGLGITGLGDCLAMLNVKYGSKESIEITEKIMLTKAYHETLASINLAKKLGSCPVFKNAPESIKEEFAYHPYFTRISEASASLPFRLEVMDIPEGIYTLGIRNIGLSTIAPAGTISVIAGNCTSGIEPLFALEYTRRSRLLKEPVTILHPPLFNYLYKYAPKDLELPKQDLLEKYNYVESAQLGYKQRIEMQSVCQLYTTDSISSTVNLPNSTTVEEVENLYKYAYSKRLKGITIYRDGCGLTGILKSTEPTEQRIELSNIEKAIRHRVKWLNSIKTYITVTYDKNRKPVEVFTKLPKEGGTEKGIFNPTLFLEKQSYWDLASRLISLLLRSKVPLNDIIKQLDRSSYSMYDLPAILKRVLVGFNDEKSNKGYEICPQCGEKTYVMENGCGVCHSCGYSHCG